MSQTTWRKIFQLTVRILTPTFTRGLRLLLFALIFWAGFDLRSYAAAPDLKDVGVLEVVPLDPKSRSIQLGDRVKLEVKNVEKLQTEARLSGKRIVLYLNGLEMTNLFHEGSLVSTSGTGSLIFPLERTTQNKWAWGPLFRKPFSGDETRHAEVNVGLQGGVIAPPPDTPVMLPLRIRSGNWQAFAGGLLIVIVVVCGGFGAGSALLRDPGPLPIKERPFSLARFQMFIWFLIVFESFIVIWIITGDADTITGSSLALLGISAGTLFAGGVASQKLESVPFPSRGFWKDITSDTGGVSLHRFQMLAWTVIIGMIFIFRVIEDMAMPELSGELLALMGISSATYVSIKSAAVAATTVVPASVTGSTAAVAPAVAAGVAPAAALVNAPGTPGTPIKPDVTLGAGGKIGINGTAVPGATSYEITVVVNGVRQQAPAASATPAFELSGLPVGANVAITMRAINQSGPGPFSPAVTTTTI